MIFYLEDNKKWSQLMHFFKTCISGNSNICFMWNNVHGWLLMQNSEYLNNLDSDHLVLLSYFKMNYFSSFVNNRDLGLDNATFEMDITRIYQSLRSIRKTTKRVMFSLQRRNGNANDNCATFVMKIFDEDGILEIYRDVYLNNNLNQHLYFNHMRNLSQDNILYLEIQQNYLKSVKEFKNCILQLKFYEEHIHVEALNGEQDLVLQINKNICNNYNFSRILSQFDNKNRLLIPPNFLISQIYLANKFNQTIQLQFGDEIVGGRVIVYMRVKNESFEIVSAFATVFDIDDQTQDNTSPFMANPQAQQQEDIQQNSYYNLNTNPNNNQQPLQQNNQNGQIHQEVQPEMKKRSNISKRSDLRNGVLDQINSEQNLNLEENNNNNQRSKLNQNGNNKNSGQMVDESQEAGNIPKRNVNKEMEVEKLGREKSNDKRNNRKNSNINILNSNQFMEVESGFENINIRKSRNNNNVVEMEDFDNHHKNPIYEDSEIDEDAEMQSIQEQKRKENGSKKRGSAVLQHLQDEFSSIEIQDGNQNRSIFSSSIGIDSRKATAHQHNNNHLLQQQHQGRQQQEKKQQIKPLNHNANLLQTDGEITDQTQPQNQRNNLLQSNAKERNKFLTEQKYQNQEAFRQMGGQENIQSNMVQSSESETENQRIHRKEGINKNQKVMGDYHQVDYEAFNSQLVYPVYHEEDMQDEDNSNSNHNGEHPRKHQKLSLMEKKNIARNNGMHDQFNDIQLQPNKNKQSMLKKLSDMQMKLVTNNKRTVKDMLQQSSQQSSAQPDNQNNQQFQPAVVNDDLKNKLFYKNEKQRQQSTTPEQGSNQVEYKFAKPAPVQGRNVFDQKKNNQNELNHKRNQEVGNYFASHTVSNQHQELDLNSYSEESGSNNDGMMRSKLLQRNQENLEMLKKEKVIKKAKRTLKQQGAEQSDYFDNITASQMDDEGAVYAKGFFQTPFLKKQKQNLQSPTMMSQLHSSQKIVQISNETSESQQGNGYNLLKNKNLFPQNKYKDANDYHAHYHNTNNYFNQHQSHREVTDSEKIDKKGIMRYQQVGNPAAAVVVNGAARQKENEKNQRREGMNGMLNSYNNPLQTNYHSLNTIQSNQSKDVMITQKTQHNNLHTGDASNSAVQRDRFEQYQKIQNRDRQLAGIDSEILKINQHTNRSISPSELPKNMTSSNRLNDSQSFKTCLESIKPSSFYSFQEPLPRSSKPGNQHQQQLNNQQEQQKKQVKPLSTESVLNKSIRDNSFDNFLKQNKKKDEFSVFSVKKTPQPSAIQQQGQQQKEKIVKNGFEFQPQQQRIKQEHITSQSEISQKVSQSKGMKLFL